MVSLLQEATKERDPPCFWKHVCKNQGDRCHMPFAAFRKVRVRIEFRCPRIAHAADVYSNLHFIYSISSLITF